MRLPAQNFQDLIVWQKAHQFVLGVYTLARDFRGKKSMALPLSFGVLLFR